MPFRAAAAGSSGSTTSAITIPSSAVIGDVALVTVENNGGTVNVFTPPSGWSPISGSTPDVNSNAISSQIYGKTIASGEPSSLVTFTGSSGSKMTSMMTVMSGVSLANAIVVGPTIKTATSTSVVAPSSTTTAINTDVLELHVTRAATTTITTLTTPTNYTADGSSSTSAANPNFGAFSFHRTSAVSASGTAVGGDTSTANQSVTNNSYLVLLTPAAFSGSLDVTGVGTTSFSATTHMQSGAFPGAGVGTLSLGATPVVSGALAVTGSGSTSFGGKPGGVGSLAMSGSGSLTLSGTPRAAGTLAVTGVGTIQFATTSGTGTLAVTGTGTTVFGSTVTTKGTLAATGVGTLLLVGKLLAAGVLTFTGSGTLVFTGRAITRHSWWDGTIWRTIAPQVWGGATLGWLTIPVTISAVGSFA